MKTLDSIKKIEPTDNITIRFKQGYLDVLGEEEQRIHDRESRLYYPSSNLGPYFIPLKDMKKLLTFEAPIYPSLSSFFGPFFGYHSISKHTLARKTLTGGLKLKRKLNGFNESGIKRTATFSKKEYETIKQYAEAI